jgi:hypothetical protein
MSTVEEIIEAARALPPEQQAELKHRLEKLSGDETNGETVDRVKTDRRELHARIHRALYEAGLVTNPNPPPKHDRERPPPIKVKGKPVSETIIEDRR